MWSQGGVGRRHKSMWTSHWRPVYPEIQEHAGWPFWPKQDPPFRQARSHSAAKQRHKEGYQNMSKWSHSPNTLKEGCLAWVKQCTWRLWLFPDFTAHHAECACFLDGEPKKLSKLTNKTSEVLIHSPSFAAHVASQVPLNLNQLHATAVLLSVVSKTSWCWWWWTIPLPYQLDLECGVGPSQSNPGPARGVCQNSFGLVCSDQVDEVIR